MHTHLAKTDKIFRSLIKQFGEIPLPTPKKTAPYEALVRAIAHQQLHGKAAETILGRFYGLYGDRMPTPGELAKTQDDKLRAVGFSGSKVAALKDIAKHAVSGVIPDLKTAKKLSDEELIARLVQIRGVGRWTVEMLLIFHLGRPDILPIDDFGVREGYRVAMKHDAQVKPKALGEAGLPWAPHRSLAALYFWRAADAAKLEKPKPAKVKVVAVAAKKKVKSQ